VPFFADNFGIQVPMIIAAQHYPFLRAFDRDFILGPYGHDQADPADLCALEETSGLSGDAAVVRDDRMTISTRKRPVTGKAHHFTGRHGVAPDRLVTAGLLDRGRSRMTQFRYLSPFGPKARRCLTGSCLTDARAPATKLTARPRICGYVFCTVARNHAA